jgi:hypothetical protein
MIYQLIFLSTEIDLIDLRLNELNDVVDKFIIVEYPFNYAGQPCKMYYNENKDRFKKFENKIIHIIDDNNYGGIRGINLLGMRQSSPILNSILNMFKDDDFLIVSDGDVYIRKEVFSLIDKSKHTSFHLEWCQYWLNVYCTHAVFTWSFGIPIGLCKELGGIHRSSHTTTGDIKVIPNAGWHWAKMGGVEKVIENIKGYPHQEYALNSRLIDPVLVQKKIDKIQGWDDPSENGNPEAWKYAVRKFDPNYYPKYIGDNLDIFSKYIKWI